MQQHTLPKLTITSKQKILDLSQPHVMGILNVTPDSFSDGGQYTQIDRALAHCEQMLQAGASIIDIGGESTRPNADKVTCQQEMDRVLPVVEAIRQRFGSDIWLSIDTSTPEVIEASVQVGADIWNDVRALCREGAVQMAARLDIPVVLMHMRGEPHTMDTLAVYDDVVTEVVAELQERVNVVVESGLSRDKIIIDPGFGFAKGYEHHKQLLSHLTALHQLQLPIMFGISRKRFLGEVLAKLQLPAFEQHQATDRDAMAMAAALIAVQQGACIIRTHNVAMTTQALALWQQMG